jgi:hypothetical protein
VIGRKVGPTEARFYALGVLLGMREKGRVYAETVHRLRDQGLARARAAVVWPGGEATVLPALGGPAGDRLSRVLGTTVGLPAEWRKSE